MQDILTKPHHTNSAHCAACRPPSLAEIRGRKTARIIDAAKEAERLYKEKRVCVHPTDQQFISVIPTTEDEEGVLIDGARVKVCRICLTVTGEVL